MNTTSQFYRILAFLALVSNLAASPQPAAPAQPKALDHKIFLPALTSTVTYDNFGPEGGEMTAYVVNPQNSAEMYAGSFGGGVYKTTDGGANWFPSSNGLVDGYIESMAIDPKTPSTVYAGMYKYGVFKSTDSGQTWHATGPGLNQDPIVYDLQVDPQNPNNLYAGTRQWTLVFTWAPPWGGGVFKSTNGGDTWTKQNNGLGEDWVYSLVIDPVNPQNVYAATHQQGVYKSTDGAATWKAVNIGIDDTAGRSIVIDPQNPQILYLGTWHLGCAFRSTDGGAHWQAVRNGLSGAKVYKLFIDPSDPKIVYAGTYLQGLYKTSNSGSNWSQVGFGGEFITSIGVDPQNHNRVFSGTAGNGVFTSSNGAGTWTSTTHGILASQATGLAQNAKYLFAGLSGGGLRRSKDGGVTWLTTPEFYNRFVVSVVVNPSNQNVVYVTTKQDGIYKSTNGGDTWSAVNGGLAVAAGASLSMALPGSTLPVDIFHALEEDHTIGIEDPNSIAPSTISYSINTLAFDWHNPAVIYLGTDTNGVMKSTNAAGSWAASGLSGKWIYNLAVDPNNTSIVYAGTDDTSGALWFSTDGGATWNARNNGISSYTVYSILISTSNTAQLFAATSNGIYYSANGGGNWAYKGLVEKKVTAFGLTAQGLFAGTANGLYWSRDGGTTWALYSNGPLPLEINALQSANSIGKIIFASTNGHGVLIYPGSAVK